MTALSLAAVIGALALTVLTFWPPREERLLLGRPGDGRLVRDGLSLPTNHLGARGRWTRGDGALTLPAYPARVTLTLRVSPPGERTSDPIEITANGLQVHRFVLTTGWNEIAFFVDPPVARGDTGATSIRIRSAVTTSGDAAGQGVFITNIVMGTGGWDALRHTPLRTWAGCSLAWLAIFAFAWQLARGARTTRVAIGVIGASVILVLAAAIAFRAGLLAHIALVAALCWCAVLGLALATSRAVSTRLSAAPTWRIAIVFLLGGLLALTLLFPQAVFDGRVLSQADMFLDFAPWSSHAPADYRAHDRPPLGDIPMFVHPFAMFTQARWWSGVFPWWTSAISSGQPFVATYQSALFSPFTALIAIVSLPRATVVIAFARLLVAGLGMFLFLRALRLSRWPAAFGGFAYLLNPVLIVALEHPLAGVLPWLPWMLLAGERLGQASDRAGAVALLAVTAALAMVGGHPHGGLFVLSLGSAYALARAWTAADRVRAIVCAVIAIALGVALAAVQILPFLEYLSLSRAMGQRANFPLNPYFAPASTLITALVPNFLGHHGAGNFVGPTNYLEQQTYPGIAIWILAALGLATHAWRWRVWFFASTTLMAMLVMYAAPGVHQIISMLPLLKAASLPRIAIVTMASLAVLAAFGLERLLQEEAHAMEEHDRARARDGDRAMWVICGAAVSIAAIALFTLMQRSAFLNARAALAFSSRWTWFAVWLAASVAALSIARLRFAVSRTAAAFALVCVLSLDLLLTGYGFHDLIPPEQVFPVTPEIAAVQQDRGLFRVLGLAQAMLPNAAMAYGLQDIRGVDGLMVARYADLLDVVLRDQNLLHLADRVASPLIDLLNVKYVFSAPNVVPPTENGWFTRITDGDTPVYRNNRVLPRAFLVDGYVVRDGNLARRTLRDGLVDFRRIALLEQEPAENDRPEIAASLDGVGSATVVRYQDHVVEIDVDAPGRRLLVLTDVHYPGWTAAIDGQSAAILRANFAFRAVAVPAGRHRIVFTYQPSSVRAGLALSAFAGVALIAFVLYERRRNTRVRVSGASVAAATPADPRSPSSSPLQPAAR